MQTRERENRQLKSQFDEFQTELSTTGAVGLTLQAA